MNRSLLKILAIHLVLSLSACIADIDPDDIKKSEGTENGLNEPFTNTDEALRLRKLFKVGDESISTPDKPIYASVSDDVKRSNVQVCKANFGNYATMITQCEEKPSAICQAIAQNIKSHSGVFSIHYALAPIANQDDGSEGKVLRELQWQDLDFEENIRLIRDAASKVSEIGIRRKTYAIQQNYDELTTLFYTERYIKLQGLKSVDGTLCRENPEKDCLQIYRLSYEHPYIGVETPGYHLNGSPVTLQERYFYDPNDLLPQTKYLPIGVMASDIMRYGDNIIIQKHRPNNKKESFIYTINKTSAVSYGMTTLPVCAIIQND